jgi:arginase
MNKTIESITAEIGIGAQITGCALGPRALLDLGLLDVLRRAGRTVVRGEHLVADASAPGADKMESVEAFVPRLADAVRASLRARRFPLVLGGDHSCAVGTWSGVAEAHRAEGNGRPGGAIGLIWIDAHLDSHTPETSESQAPHGMPLAALLGHGAPALTDLYGWRAKLSPRHVVVIGARSWEAGEAALLKSLGVRVMTIDEVAQRGLPACIDEAVHIVSTGTVGYGVSFDVDAIDPHDAPGVGSPEAGGIRAHEAVLALTHFAADPRLLAFELVEYNPQLDDARGSTAALCDTLLASALGGRESQGSQGVTRSGVQGTGCVANRVSALV